MKSKKHISLLLLICFSVFLGHSFLPHHHHTEIVNLLVGTGCPVHHSDHQEEQRGPGEHPVHCHAFNETVFEKYVDSGFQSITRLIHAMLVPGAANSACSGETGSFSGYHPCFINVQSPGFPGAVFLRAPPPSV
jgi:hypothetical protein